MNGMGRVPLELLLGIQLKIERRPAFRQTNERLWRYASMNVPRLKQCMTSASRKLLVSTWGDE